MELRDYQKEAVQAVYRHLQAKDSNPCVVIPTGGGKTPVMAQICQDAVNKWNGRVLVLAHVKELLQQTARTLNRFGVRAGVYSAGLKSKQTDAPVIVAGIQSAYRNPAAFGRRDIVLVDEAHLIPPEGDGMYRTFLTESKKICPHQRLVGLTATPYRLKGGLICKPENLLNEVCFEVTVKELIRDGYICNLVSKAAVTKQKTDGLHIRAGEFVSEEVQAITENEELVVQAVAEMVELTKDRKAVLVFCASVLHGHMVHDELLRQGQEVGQVYGDTPADERARMVKGIKAGRIKYLVNVNVLTTGFDAPNIDAVVLLRPTASAGLYYQMCGRGFRICEGKENCLVLDYGNNVLRHGPIDAIRIKEPGKKQGGSAPAKECPECRALIHASIKICPDCGYEFPRPPARHLKYAAEDAILSGEVTIEEMEVIDTTFHVHAKRNAEPDTPKTMRVDYQVSIDQFISEWVCFEHKGFARKKAERWWRERSDAPTPDTAEDAVYNAAAGALAETNKIIVKYVSGERFPEIVGHDLGEVPVWGDLGKLKVEAVDEEEWDVPF